MASDVEIIVRGVLIHGGKLLVCRNRQQSIFLPGGHVEFDEPAADALKREIGEELGVSLVVGRFIGACEAAFDQVKMQSTKRHHEINLVFALVPPPAFKPADLRSLEDHILFDWLELDQLSNLLPGGISRLLQNDCQWVSSFERTA